MLRNERGGIGNLLAILLLILLSFVGYQMWTSRNKSTTSAPAATPQAPSSPALTATPGQPVVPPPIPTPAAQGMRPPPLAPGTTIAAAQAASLMEIHELITRGAAGEAEAKLIALPSDALNDPQARQAAAVLWNNLGLLHDTQSRTAPGVAAFKKAVSLNPEEPAANVNLLYAYLKSNDPGLTLEFTEKVMRLAPENPMPHLAMANLLYDKDDLAGAAQHLDHARELTTQHPELRAYLDYVSEKVKRTEKAEQRYASRQSGHFMVKFDGGEDHAVWDRVLDILEDAYRDIGQKFSYYPSKPITVVLHTKASFQGATGSPAWADGLYDMTLGRIQIPTQGALTDQAWLSRVLRHEYVHALLHDRTGGEIFTVPTWLNEGLAMQLAGDPWPDIDQIARGDITLVPLNYLERGFAGLPQDGAMVAYLEGNSATRYLIDRYGMGKVQDLIENLATGQHISSAMKDRLYITYEQLQDRRVETLNDRIRAGRN
jgi:tetratricopeptide (TPR) repeat protein